jgi:FkbM family methyltransferase
VNHERYTLLRELAAEFHVEHLAIRGEYGLIQGPATDNVILRWYAMTGVWSAETNALVAAHLLHGGTFVDVGANLGLTTVPAARLAGVRVEAFEPDPICYRHLAANVAANVADADVVLHNLAAYDRDAVVAFEQSTINHGDNRVRVTDAPGALGEEARVVLNVRTARVDDIVRLQGPVAVKVDTQGAEPFVIEGARETLARAGLVCLEYWPYGMRRQAADARVVHEWLRQFPTVGVRSETGAVEELANAAACARLEALDADDPESYVDVIVRRA